MMGAIEMGKRKGKSHRKPICAPGKRGRERQMFSVNEKRSSGERKGRAGSILVVIAGASDFLGDVSLNHLGGGKIQQSRGQAAGG